MILKQSMILKYIGLLVIASLHSGGHRDEKGMEGGALPCSLVDPGFGSKRCGKRCRDGYRAPFLEPGVGGRKEGGTS